MRPTKMEKAIAEAMLGYGLKRFNGFRKEGVEKCLNSLISKRKQELKKQHIKIQLRAMDLNWGAAESVLAIWVKGWGGSQFICLKGLFGNVLAFNPVIWLRDDDRVFYTHEYDLRQKTPTQFWSEFSENLGEAIPSEASVSFSIEAEIDHNHAIVKLCDLEELEYIKAFDIQRLDVNCMTGSGISSSDSANIAVRGIVTNATADKWRRYAASFPKFSSFQSFQAKYQSGHQDFKICTSIFPKHKRSNSINQK